MNRETLISSLRKIETLVRDCLTVLEDEDTPSPKPRRESRVGKHAKTHRTGRGLPDRIIEIRDADFFKEPRTAHEVHEKIRGKYPCEANRVEVALLRLNERKKLRKASKLVDKKRQVAYVW